MDAYRTKKLPQRRVSCSSAPVAPAVENEFPVRISWSVASYRDGELADTLLSAFHFAHFPGRLFPVVLWQGELHASCCLCRTEQAAETRAGAGRNKACTEPNTEQSCLSRSHFVPRFSAPVQRNDVAHAEMRHGRRGGDGQQNGAEASRGDEGNPGDVKRSRRERREEPRGERSTNSKCESGGNADASDAESLSLAVSSRPKTKRHPPRRRYCRCWCHKAVECLSSRPRTSIGEEDDSKQRGPSGGTSSSQMVQTNAHPLPASSPVHCERHETLGVRRPQAPSPKPPATAVEDPAGSCVNEESFDLWEVARFIWHRMNGPKSCLAQRRKISTRKTLDKKLGNLPGRSGEIVRDGENRRGKTETGDWAGKRFRLNKQSCERPSGKSAHDLINRTNALAPTQPRAQTPPATTGVAAPASRSTSCASSSTPVTSPFAPSLKRAALREIADLLPRWLQLSLRSSRCTHPEVSFDNEEGVWAKNEGMEGDHERTRSGNLPLRCFLLSVALPSFPPSQEDEESSSVLKDAGNDGDPSLARPLADAEHTHEGANRVLRIPVLEILLPQPNKNPFAAALAAGGQSPSAPCSRTASEPPSVVASSRSCFQLSRSSDASAWARDASPSESGQGSEGEDNAATGEEAHDAGRNVEDELGEEAWETDEDGDETAVMCLAFMDWRDSRGPCFARALCEWLLPTSPLREATAVRKPGETRLELLLQTDSHMRFAPHFDCFLLNQLTLAAALSAETKRARSPSTLSPPSHAFSLSANASPARSSAPPSACSSLLVTEKVVLTGYPPGYEEGLPFFEFPQPPHTSGTTESPSVGACPSDDTRHLPPRPSSQTFSLPCVSSSSSSRSCEREGFATPHAPSASRSRRLCASGLEAASALPAHGGQEPRGQSEEGRSEGTEEERPTGRRNEPGEGGQDLDLAEWTKEKTGQRFPEVYFPGILLCAGHFDRNGLLRTKGRALRFDGSASKAEPRGSGGDSQGATRNRCSYAGSSSASAPPLASASFSAAADPVPSESSGFSLEEGSREGNLSMKMTHLVRPPTACACSCLHCCELEEAPGTCEQERASLAESPASSVSSSALSLSPSFSPSTCLFPLKSLFWAAGFSFAPARVIREVGYDPRLQFVFFGEEQTMTLRLFTHGWSFFAPRFSVVFHLWTRARRPFFKTDLRHLFSEKEKPLGDTCLAVSSSISSSVCSPFSSSVCSSLSSISSSVSSSVCSSVSSRALPPAGSTQKRVEAVETRREITSTAERKRQRREERKAKGEKEECRDGWKATQGRTEAESPSGSESQGPAPATTQEGKEGRSAGTCGELEADRNGEEETKDTRDACKGTRAREAERLPARLGAYVSEDGDWKERKSGNKLQWDQTEGSKEAATAGLETNEAKKTDAWRNADTHETRDRIATTRKGLIGDEQKSSRASYASHSFDLSAVARPPSCSPWGGSRGLPSPASSSASLPPFWAGSLSPASSPSLPRSAFASMLSPGEARVRRILSATASSCPAELRSLGLGSERPPEAFWREIGVNVETRFISKRARDGGYSEDIFQVTAKEHQTQREGVQLLLSLLREHEKETRC